MDDTHYKAVLCMYTHAKESVPYIEMFVIHMSIESFYCVCII